MRRPLLLLLVASIGSGCAAPVSTQADVADVSVVDVTTTDVSLADIVPERAQPEDAALEAAADAAADVTTEDARAEDVTDDVQNDVPNDVPDDVPNDVRSREMNCSNGADDDLDGVADCADPDCEPVVRCVAAPESGWSSPGVLNTGTTAPACAAPYDTQSYLGNADLMAPPATCSACSCGTPTDLRCTLQYVCERTSGCAGICTARSVEGSGCVDAPGATSTFTGRSGTAASGRCAPGTATATRPPATWGRAARLCTAASGAAGCASGQVCVPRVASAPRACVVRAGDVACPAAYSVKQVFYGALDDTRACSTCSCTVRATGCTVSYVAYNQPACAGTATPFALDACISGDPASYRITHTVTSATCAAVSGGAPTGTVTAAMPSTVCCTP